MTIKLTQIKFERDYATSVPIDPWTFTVATLKSVCRNQGLSTTGIKKIIKILQESDPSDEWIQQAELVQNNPAPHHHDEEEVERDTHDPRDRELDLIKPEHELTLRELD